MSECVRLDKLREVGQPLKWLEVFRPVDRLLCSKKMDLICYS